MYNLRGICNLRFAICNWRNAPCRPIANCKLAIANLVLLLALPAYSQFNGAFRDPPPEVKQSDVVEHLGAQVDLELRFVNEAGQSVRLGDYFTGRRPVILQLGYFECPMLCTLVSQGMVDSLAALTLRPAEDFEVLYVSIDPAEKPNLAAAKKATIVKALNKPGAEEAIHLLTGEQQAITSLTEAVGFKYAWVPDSKQFAHPAVLVLVSPQGRVMRYLYGVAFDARTLRLSLVEASQGKIGSTADRFILTCFQYDGSVGKYAMTARRLMQIGGGLTALVLGSIIFLLIRRDIRRDRARPAPAP
jgi:protein SCO1/2